MGPYEEKRGGGKRYRVVIVDEGGERTTFFKETEKEARRLVNAAWKTLNIPLQSVVTTPDAVGKFIAMKVGAKKWSKRTVDRTGKDLKDFADMMPGAPIGVVNTSWVLRYIDQNSELSLAYQRSRYHAVAEFLRWCERRRYIKGNPCAGIHDDDKPWVGKRAKRLMGRGKPQLAGEGEALAYLEASRKVERLDVRVAAALPLLNGMRSGEVRHLLVRNVDFEGGKFRIRDVEEEDNDLGVVWDVKTASGRRPADIPEVLVEDLKALCADKSPEEFVFASGRKDGGPYSYQWLWRAVKRICAAAGTRVVNPQGLRDTYSTLLVEMAGLDAIDVGRKLGHGDSGQTARKHYIGVPEPRPALRLVEGGQR